MFVLFELLKQVDGAEKGADIMEIEVEILMLVLERLKIKTTPKSRL